jgi:hypothetical protein
MAKKEPPTDGGVASALGRYWSNAGAIGDALEASSKMDHLDESAVHLVVFLAANETEAWSHGGSRAGGVAHPNEMPSVVPGLRARLGTTGPEMVADGWSPLIHGHEKAAGLIRDASEDDKPALTVEDSRVITAEQQALIAALLENLPGARLSSAIQSLGGLGAVAQRMLAGIPDTNDLDAAVGPFYDTASLRKWLGVSKQAVAQRLKSRSILGVRSSDGFWMYPSFQFTSQREPLPRLKEVLDAIDPGSKDPWQSAIWLNHPVASLDGHTPAEALRTGLAEKAVQAANRIHSALSR